MTPEIHKKLQENYPFLTIVSYLDNEYIGIMQHADSNFVSLYVLETNLNQEMKKEFLLCGETWWWESNRSIPINLFLRERFKPFKGYLKTFAKKEATIVEGPVVNMLEMVNKKMKRRTIQLSKED
jgi:hypothetical protein